VTYGGFLEARLTLAAALTFEVRDTTMGAPATVTIPAGNYYPRQLVAEMETQTNLVSGGSFEFDLLIDPAQYSPSQRGRVRIRTSDDIVSLTWTSTALRDAIGWTAGITSTVTEVIGPQVARGVWIPGVDHRFSRYGHLGGTAEKGDLITDYRATVGPTGTVHALYSTQHRRHRGIRWDGVPSNRAKQHHEVVVDESFEAFALDCMTNRFSLIPVNPYVKLSWTTEAGPTTVGRLLWPAVFEMQTLITGWSGRYVVSLPELVEESA
jgi:hypothetical protein